MLLVNFKTTLCSLLLFNSLALAANENILSSDRLKLFELNSKQNKEDAAKLKKDWINPITYKLSQTTHETYNPLKSTIAISQPIFKSGGIFQAILYANSVERYSNLDIEIQKKTMIKEATELLFNIHKINYSIQKQELLIKNANLDVLRKREQVLNGLTDASYLDNAILDANIKKNTLLELEYQKHELINNFDNLANQSYTKFDLPKLELISTDNYLDNNLTIKQSKESVQTKDHFQFMTISKYLPTVNFTYDYTKYHDKDNNPSLEDNTVMGFNMTIPLDINTFNDIQSNRIEYLKSRVALNTTRLEEENFYKTKISKIEMIESKKSIANEDFILYNSLLEDITQAANAGLNAKADVETLANSKEIKAFDIKILELEKQIELLELYAKMEI